MKYLFLVLSIGLSCKGSDNYSLPAHILLKQGTLMKGHHGELLYTVMYDNKKDCFSGFFVNKNFVRQDWICKEMDCRIAKFYYQKDIPECHGCRCRSKHGGR